MLSSRPLKQLPAIIAQPLRGVLEGMLNDVTKGPKTSLLNEIKSKGGLSLDELPDITGEEKAQRAWGPGLFSKNGLSSDDMVQRLIEDGYMSEADRSNPDDNGGINKLAEIVKEELAGQKHYSIQQEDNPETLGDWYKNLNAKNKQPTTIAAISRILDSQTRPISACRQPHWSARSKPKPSLV